MVHASVTSSHSLTHRLQQRQSSTFGDILCACDLHSACLSGRSCLARSQRSVYYTTYNHNVMSMRVFLYYQTPVLVSSKYQTPVLVSSKYQTPVLVSSKYQTPVLVSSKYQTPVLVSSKYQTPVLVSSKYQTPVLVSSKYQTPVLVSSK